MAQTDLLHRCVFVMHYENMPMQYTSTEIFFKKQKLKISFEKF